MKLIKIFLILSIMAGVAACDFGDANINPALPANVSAEAIIPAAQAGMAFAIGGEVVRINGLFMQHFEGINAQQFDNYRYFVRGSDMDGVWLRMYYNTMNPMVTVLRKAEENDSRHTAGMTKVLLAHCIGTVADMFGDVPYSNAFQGLDDNFFPTYDSQEQVYNTIQQLLDDAIADLNSDGGSGIPLGGEDLIYGGDTDAWVKVANSLKAKYYLHLSKINGEAYSLALGVSKDGLSSVADDFQFTFGTNANEANPQYQFSQDRGGNISFASFFQELVIGLNDPRAAAFFEADADEPLGFNDNFNTGTYYTTINSPVVYMSFAELKFIEAEAHLMGNSDVDAAEMALKEAIAASLDKITGAVDQDYVDTNGDLASLAGQDAQLERIITQKYIALYSHGLETWTDFRRTGYPAITPVEGGNNAFNLNGEVPRRLPYPQTEIDLNSSNVPITSPNLQNPFWWDDK